MGENKIVVVDYGLGNLASIHNMLKKIGQSSIITSDLDIIDKSTKIILPGVGAFNNAMENIRMNNLFDTLNKKVMEDKVPILGICLGMQIMCNSSEEGGGSGFGWIDAEVLKFNFKENTNNLKIPHMGWNVVHASDKVNLFANFSDPFKFYHVHSYYVKVKNENESIATTFYGHTFTSAFQKENIYGVQFHPEKSHNFGMQLLSNFASIKC